MDFEPRDLAQIGRAGVVSRRLARAVAHRKVIGSHLVAFAIIGRPRKHERVVVAQRNGVRFKLNLGEDLHRLIYLDLLEPKLAPVLLGGVCPGGLFVDVGANVGYWSLLAAARGSRVIAFEPGPPMVESFKENIALNPQLHDIDIRPVAVSDHPHDALLSIPENGERGLANLHSTGGSGVTIQAQTLDQALAIITTPIDVLKMDIEGHEVQALAGAEDTFARLRPRLVAVELVGAHLARAGKRPEDVTQWLLDHHYTPTHWLPDRWMPGGGESYRPDPSMLLRSRLPDNMNGNSVWRLKTDVESALDVRANDCTISGSFSGLA